MLSQLWDKQSTLAFVVSAAAGLYGAVVLYKWRRNTKVFPPGPPSYPLVGSLFSWPTSQEWLTYTKWKREYGDIVYADVAGTKITVLNSLSAAKSLLDDRGAIYSDRAHLHFANDLVGWKDSPIMFAASHPHFKPARKMMLEAVGSRGALENYVYMEQHETHRFLRRVIDEPEKVESHLRQLAGTVILKVLYGYDAKPGDDEYISLIERLNADLNKAASPGNFMVDFIPALKYVPRWLPGTNWMIMMDRMRSSLDEALTKPINFVKDQLATGKARPSFVGSALERSDFNAADEPCLAWTALALYVGGADTSVSSLYTFFLCMTLFPDAQAKAQEELDAVIGSGVLPAWSDQDRLPYVNALITETMRWGPVLPQALPHCGNTDAEFEGYFLPKGTLAIVNTWGFSRDPSRYPQPEMFKPERFLGPSPQADPRDFAFGFGRRICPGRQLGEVTLFLVASSALATLSICKKMGANGQLITPKVEYTGGAVVYPSKFDCCISPRNAEAETLIRSVHDAPYAG